VAFIVPDGQTGNNPRIISAYYDFHWNFFYQAMKKAQITWRREQVLSLLTGPALRSMKT
jgi:hypothetical protein